MIRVLFLLLPLAFSGCGFVSINSLMGSSNSGDEPGHPLDGTCDLELEDTDPDC